MSDPTKREVKRADQLQPGDVVVLDSFNGGEAYRTVRLSEPVRSEPDRYLIVFAGAETHTALSTTPFELATREEIAAHEALRRDTEKRARMRAGLMTLVAAIDDGLPLPSAIGIDMRLFATPDDVQAWAAALDTEVVDKETDHGRSVAIRRHSLAGESGRSLPDVDVDVWHLGDRRFARGHDGSTTCCTYGCPAVES